jgi:hypothetical protein
MFISNIAPVTALRYFIFSVVIGTFFMAHADQVKNPPAPTSADICDSLHPATKFAAGTASYKVRSQLNKVLEQIYYYTGRQNYSPVKEYTFAMQLNLGSREAMIHRFLYLVSTSEEIDPALIHDIEIRGNGILQFTTSFPNFEKIALLQASLESPLSTEVAFYSFSTPLSRRLQEWERTFTASQRRSPSSFEREKAALRFREQLGIR